MVIQAENLDYRALNEALRKAQSPCTVAGCCGQRFLAAGMAGKEICVEGIAGNALGAYLNGALVTVRANAQDAVGDTMNAGKIVIHGITSISPGQTKTPLLRSPAILKNTATCSASITIS